MGSLASQLIPSMARAMDKPVVLDPACCSARVGNRSLSQLLWMASSHLDI